MESEREQQSGTGIKEIANPLEGLMDINNVDFTRALVQGHAGIPWVTGFRGDPNDGDAGKWHGRPVRKARDVPNGTSNSYLSVALFDKEATRRLKENAIASIAVVLKSASSAAAGGLERFSGQAAIRFRDGSSMILMDNARRRA
jgi:murein tripeptide amidase MpaA